MPRYIEINFLDDKVVAKAILLEAEAPQTCKALVKHMPYESTGYHARYSGAEVAMFLPRHARTLVKEHATSCVLPGEVGYVYLHKENHFNLKDDVSEICWFYDRDAQPREWEGPVKVNIFARVIEGFEAFAKASADCRLVGPKRVRVALLDEDGKAILRGAKKATTTRGAKKAITSRGRN